MLISHMRKLEDFDLLGLVDIVGFAPGLLTLTFGTNGGIVWDGGASVGRRAPTLGVTLEILALMLIRSRRRYPTLVFAIFGAVRSGSNLFKEFMLAEVDSNTAD
jgi:hypothetical protein